MRQEGFEKYFQNWVSGLNEEIHFWRYFMKEKGGLLFYGFEKTISSKRCFELEEDIPKQMYGEKYKFIDVGAGPFSRCGFVTDKVNLDAVSVDPLACVYAKLKEVYGIENGVKLKTGFVELLSDVFEPNSFDMVHMSNALDHSFDPIYGIYQLLYICKIGGVVVLRHAENEAEKEAYKGLHQWNLSLHNDEKSFVIWRNNERYNICDIFKEYADIEFFSDIKEKDGTWVYNKVVFRKKKDIELPISTYFRQMFSVVYDNLLEMLLNIEMEKGVVPESKAESICKKIRNIYYNPCGFVEAINQRNVDSVSIYGMGYIGKAFFELVKKCNIKISYLIDRERFIYKEIQTCGLEEYEKKGDNSLVIVCVMKECDLIIEELSKFTNNDKIMFVDDLLNEMAIVSER